MACVFARGCGTGRMPIPQEKLFGLGDGGWGMRSRFGLIAQAEGFEKGLFSIPLSQKTTRKLSWQFLHPGYIPQNLQLLQRHQQ